MLVRSAADDKVTVVDFGARSPMRLDPRDYPIVEGPGSDLFGWPRVKDDRNLVGPHSIAAPTLVAGIAQAHEIFGRKYWRDLVEPAADLAAQGPVVDWHSCLIIATAFADLARDPGARGVFLPAGVPPVPPPASVAQSVLRLPNKALAKTLGMLADEGSDAFYHGEIGRALRVDLRDAEAILSMHDFAACEPRVVTSRIVKRRGQTIHVLPVLSGGPTLTDAFDAMESAWPGGHAGPALGPEAFTAIASSLRRAWEKRFDAMGDTATTAPQSSTTHISVVDRDGNMVALTQTLLSLFGSRYMSPSTGILMNNAINWFDPRPGGPNSLGPAKRVLANYCPAIMLGPAAAVAIGGCGGRKIIPAVFQLLAMLAEGHSLDDSFHAPRIDVSGGDTIVVDRDLPHDVRAALGAQFKTVEVERAVYPYHFAIAGAVRRQGNINEGATEPHQPWSEAVSEEEM